MQRIRTLIQRLSLRKPIRDQHDYLDAEAARESNVERHIKTGLPPNQYYQDRPKH